LPLEIKDLDFRFENSQARIVANRNHPEIKLAGITVGPLQEGSEYELNYWIAHELVKAGIAHFREDDRLDAAKLYKIQWRERVQIAGQISELPENFYPKLRRYIADLKEEISKQPEKIQEYEKARYLMWDIINSRLKKIVALSSGPAQTEEVLKKFTGEERLVYEQVSKFINQWKRQIAEQKREG
jgi:hypothetical protein